MKRFLLLAAAVTLGVGAAMAPVAAQSPRGLVQDGETPDLFVLSTGDVIGYVDPCG